MALKRHLGEELSSATITIGSGSGRSLSSVPPLKLRLKDLKESLVQRTVQDIASLIKKGERSNAISSIAEINLATLNKEDAEDLLRMLKDILRNEDDKVIKGRALNAMTDILKVASVNRILAADELIELGQKEGEITLLISSAELQKVSELGN